MPDPADDESFSGPDATRTPTQGPLFSPHDEDSPAHPATEAAQPRPAGDAGRDHTATATGGPWPGGAAGHGRAGSQDSGTATAQSPGSAEVRYGRGVPGAAPAGQADVSAEEVWRTGQLPARPPRRGQRRLAGTALTAVLLIACGVVIYLRLHHAPLTVTGVAITSQAKNGCAVDVTGRISTNAGAGTVSYQWVFTPQVTAPQPLSQSVTAGQSAVYVTVSAQGTGHGQASQQVTLQVLGPGQGRASTHVNISC
jgi:hypothetical protein